MKGKSRFNQSIYIVLLYRIGIVMVLFMLCRLLFYLYNRDLFSGIHIADAVSIAKGGLVFDLAAMFYFNILFILLSLLPLPFIDKSWYQKILKTVFFCNQFYCNSHQLYRLYLLSFYFETYDQNSL